MRLFFALQVPVEMKAAFDEIAVALDRVKWVPAENRHLTLAFLGDIDESDRNLVLKTAAGIHCPAFDIRVCGVGAFPSPRKAAVLWAGVEPSDPLLSLRRMLVGKLTNNGLFEDNRSFRSHITLARSTKRTKIDARSWIADHHDFSPRRFRIQQFHLISSKLTSTGSIYRKVESYSLHEPDTL